MSFGSHTQEIRRLLAIMLMIVSYPAGFALAQAVGEQISEETLTQAKSTYQDAWYSAARAVERRTELEKNLQIFDQNVRKAKQNLEDVTKQRLDVRKQIAIQRILIDTIQKQMQSLSDSASFYNEIEQSQKDELVIFIRYMAAKQIEGADTGPVAGGTVLRQVLRGSLGDIIEQDLNRQALLQARQRYLTELAGFMTETDKAHVRLTQVKTGLEADLNALTDKYVSLDTTQAQTKADLDQTWRAKVLTEQDLKDVQSETADVNAQMDALKSQLITINTQLKVQREKTLGQSIADMQSQRTALETKLAELQKKQSQLIQTKEEESRLYETALQLKNSDRNLYKRIIELEARLSTKEAAYHDKIETVLTAAQTPEESDKLKAESISYLAEITRMKDKLVLMRQGIPEDAADNFVRAKSVAQMADRQLVDVQTQLHAVNADIADLSGRLSDTQAQLEQARKQSAEIDAFPPLFQWPVYGPITAGYLDPDYEKVFHVPHQAIDIATAQGTPVRVIADGIVFKVRDGGPKGFSYVLIGHRNGYASLYGHVSKFLVKQGDIVFGGQTIALSGGAPGTYGAGPMTTGSHLHLEVTLNGAHIDPRTILSKR